MSKGPWKPETKSKHGKRPAVKPVVFEDPDKPAPASSVPPPLAPLSSPSGSGGGPAGDGAAPQPAPGVVFDESKIKGGLGTAFCSVTQGLAALINHLLRSSRYEVEFTPVEPEMGALWAEFAFPVLKLHLPDLEKNPHLVLVLMTGMILSGKIRIKTREVKVYGEPNRDGDTAPKENSEAVA